jgi:demethylmenaquinone methyltransferase/2-methoxy-6-polyprenyl-1,4-benzoquinol methylase
MTRLTEKGRAIRQMFDDIAPRYDLLNRMLSCGIDRRWRQLAVHQLAVPPGGRVLDVATGTGDVALEIARQTDPSVRITGADFTQGMLVLGHAKIAASSHAGRIELVNAACEALPCPEYCFDGVTIAFGIRNVVDRVAGLQEMVRVLKPGGRLVVLEFATPRRRLFRAIYLGYFHHLLPRLGGLLSRRSAYQYLPESVQGFPDRPSFLAMMGAAGLTDLRTIELTGGIAVIYVGTKP